MKKVILSLSFVVCSMLAAAQSSNKSIVLDKETGKRYLTDQITSVAGGGVKVVLDPAELVSTLVPVDPPGPVSIKIVRGPAFKEQGPGGSSQKTCFNENIWPCMIIKSPSSE